MIDINFAQSTLRHQFPGIEGLGQTLLQEKPTAQKIHKGVQIIFDRGNHWIVASNIHGGGVKVYDSIYSSLDLKTLRVVNNLFNTTTGTMDISMADMQRQEGANDCGVFAIAVVTAVLFGEDPSCLCFEQSAMWSHLVHCFNKQCFEMFSVKIFN